ncbi:alpha/beta hydrolase, partial [Patescibacteria group bacterium]|nr:alpha/beta hydrolase [Patescibacteria group bacterium]
MFTTIRSLKISYEVLGEGEPILLLHGWGGSLESMKALGSRLKDQGFKVILVDLPGFGKSDKPREAFWLEDYAQIIEEFLKQLEIENPVLFGHSFGGAISIKITTRKNVKVKKLILCNSSGIRLPKEKKQKVVGKVAKIVKAFARIPLLGRLYPYLRKFFYYYILGERDYIDHQEIAGTFEKVIVEDLTE